MATRPPSPRSARGKLGEAADGLRPMLASVGASLPTGKDWVFEPKYDGIRVLGAAFGDAALLLSRNGLEKTKQFPEIAEALAAVARRSGGLIVDGEIVALDGGAPARFQRLQGRMHVTDTRAIASHRTESPAALIVFDLLMAGEKPLVTEAWTARRKRLESVLEGAPEPLRISEVRTDGNRMLEEARRAGWEGIMAKRVDAAYKAGVRTKDWLKLKIEQRQEFVVGGYTEPRNSRSHFGAILLGYHDGDGNLIYAGHTGGGFSNATLGEMYKRLKPIGVAKSPFTTTPKTNERAHWVRPEVVVEVKFNEWTAGGHLRQPIFVGVRDDKDASDVVREPVSRVAEGEVATRKRAASTVSSRAKSKKQIPRRGTAQDDDTAKKQIPRRKAAQDDPTEKARKQIRRRVTRDDVLAQLDAIENDGGKGTLELDTGPIDITNMGKVFYPDSGHTKGDLLRYYATVAPYILPAIADRPLVLRRFPNGIKGMAFYQQKAPDETPASVRVESVSDEGITTQRRLIGGDLATLMYIVQLGAVSVDPWHSRVQSIEHADYSIIDLDPGPKATFERVIQVALWVKEVLDELGLRAVPKTSGASGMHIVLPLGPKVPNDSARMVAELVATTVADRHPKEATVTRAVKARAATAVYVDYLQNIRGKTVAGVYSARASKGATISAPLEWKEIKPGLKPSQFTIDNIEARLKKVGDLWAKGMKKPNDLKKLGKR
ncbi:MAG TPA: DNA ligase D [Gemmatimonadaceae bacterium]|nr:DNA ligase D [Gemmatimonadaceae bacterium]